MRKTVALTPYFGFKDPKHLDCIEAFKAQGGIHRERRGWQYIDQARAWLIEMARAEGADVAFFIDHDMVFDPDDVERLAEVAREERAVVAAAYARRGMGGNSIVGTFAESVDEVIFFEGGSLYEAITVGFGFAAIPLEALSVLDSLPRVQIRCTDVVVRPYFQHLVEEGYYEGEDVSFCKRFRQAGGKLLIDSRVRVIHQGALGFGIEQAATPPLRAPSVRAELRHRLKSSPAEVEREIAAENLANLGK